MALGHLLSAFAARVALQTFKFEPLVLVEDVKISLHSIVLLNAQFGNVTRKMLVKLAKLIVYRQRWEHGLKV